LTSCAALRPLILAAAQEVNALVVGGISAEDLAVTRRTLLAVIDNLGRDAADAALATRLLRGPEQDGP
jgi:hypothetical protein